MFKTRGFTLLEILIAMVVLAVSVVAIVGLFSSGLVGSADAENTTIAMNLAQGRMEEIKNLNFDTGIANETKADVDGFSGFQREVVVAEAGTDLKQVTASVYWTFKGEETSVSLATYISKN